jgi:hypothetical protein
LSNLFQPDALHAASRNGPAQHLPYEADRLDTTQQVLLRFRLHQMRRSINLAGY